jgi:hypothetical protein
MTQEEICLKRESIETEIKNLHDQMFSKRLELRILQKKECNHPKMIRTDLLRGRAIENCPDCGYHYNGD